MSYLVIYPKRLMIQKLESDHCPGTLLCDVLQYGLMVEAMRTSVAMVFEDAGPNGFYRIEVRQMEAITQRYVMKFERCLNEFLFGLKGMQPNFLLQNGIPTWNAYFSEICFLLAGDRFEVAAIHDKRLMAFRR
ncbi:MAG: hypothetical protein RLZZ24_1438 [Pseudomonadota bacterium]|jgi:hypothetical protein